MKIQKKKTKKQNKLLNFLNSYQAICVALSILSIFLLVYHMIIIKNINLYKFGGAKDDFVILDGTIYTGYDINRFSAPSIIYNGEPIKIKDFKIGYYIDNKNISVIEGSEEVDLYNLIRASEFSFSETHNDAYFLSKENMKKIDKLHFVIEGTNDQGEKINIDIPIDVNKISK